MPEISVMVDGGKATAAAPLGPALGPLGINIGLVVAQINEKTSAFEGVKVPVKVIVDASKNFEVVVGSPPTSALIKKELGLQKGAANPKTERLGSLSMEQAKKIAQMKLADMNSSNLDKAMREVIGSCDSMGVFVEGKRAKEIQKEIEQGKWQEIGKSQKKTKKAKAI